MRPSVDESYMDMAEVWSRRSHAIRRKVGCLVVKDKQIISDGYNGTPHGFDNACEDEINGELVTKNTVLHAELNALMKLARSTQSSDGATMYVTLSPCQDCANMIIQAGIKRVVFREAYRVLDGIDRLRNANITVEQLGQ